jgi:hypothetical protein
MAKMRVENSPNVSKIRVKSGGKCGVVGNPKNCIIF